MNMECTTYIEKQEDLKAKTMLGVSDWQRLKICVCASVCELMPTLFALSTFGPRFIGDRGKSVALLYFCATSSGHILRYCVSVTRRFKKNTCKGYIMV